MIFGKQFREKAQHSFPKRGGEDKCHLEFFQKFIQITGDNRPFNTPEGSRDGSASENQMSNQWKLKSRWARVADRQAASSVSAQTHQVSSWHHICQFFYTSTFSKFWQFTPKKRVNHDILNLKYYIFGVFIHLIHLIGIISQFSYVYADFIPYQWVKHGLILPKTESYFTTWT